MCCVLASASSPRVAPARTRKCRPTRHRSTCPRRRRAMSSRTRPKHRHRCHVVAEPARNAPARPRPTPPRRTGSAGAAESGAAESRAASGRSRRNPQPKNRRVHRRRCRRHRPARKAISSAASWHDHAREHRSQPRRLSNAHHGRSSAVRSREAIHPSGRGRRARRGICVFAKTLAEKAGALCRSARWTVARYTRCRNALLISTRIAPRSQARTVCHAWHPACSRVWHLSSSRNLREEAHLPVTCLCTVGGRRWPPRQPSNIRELVRGDGVSEFAVERPDARLNIDESNRFFERFLTETVCQHLASALKEKHNM